MGMCCRNMALSLAVCGGGGGGGEAERLREGGGLRDRTAGIQMHSH